MVTTTKILYTVSDIVMPQINYRNKKAVSKSQELLWGEVLERKDKLEKRVN